MVLSRETLKIISEILGWGYFSAWSISFYPQLYLNFKRKSVNGLSIEFLISNCVGFSCYGIFTFLLYFNDFLRSEFNRYYASVILVTASDLVFTLHALIITIITLIQYIYLKGGHVELSFPATVILSITLSFIAVFALVCLFKPELWVHFVYSLTFIKIISSICKYIPQVILNYQLKSTAGWSIGNNTLDLTGGILSEGQLFLDAYLADDFQSLIGHPVKLALGMTSFIFDFIFFYQHFIAYRHNRPECRTPRFERIGTGSDSDIENDEESQTKLLRDNKTI